MSSISMSADFAESGRRKLVHTVQLVWMMTALGVSEFIYVRARVWKIYIASFPGLLITANALADRRPQSRR